MDLKHPFKVARRTGSKPDHMVFLYAFDGSQIRILMAWEFGNAERQDEFYNKLRQTFDSEEQLVSKGYMIGGTVMMNFGESKYPSCNADEHDPGQ